MSITIASKIPFTDLCRLYEKLSTAVQKKKGEILNKYLKYFRDYGDNLKTQDPQTDVSFFPVMRLLLPHMDRSRGAYGVKEHTLAQILIRILCIPKDEFDAQKLLHFRAPKTAGNLAGDFAEVAFWILKKRCDGEGKLSLEKLNTHLDSIAEKNASNDRRALEAELVTMLQEMSATEQKWLIRLLLKDVRLGLGHKRVLGTFHPDAQNLYDVCNDLEKVCTVLKDPTVRLHEVEIELFSPFRPMLSEQCDVQKIDDFFKKHQYYYIETKYDGERFQIHYKDGAFKYFSRNAFDFTKDFGHSRFDGSISPQLIKQIKSNVRNFIADGEMMVWDSRKKFFRTKGENIEVKSLKGDGHYRPCYCVFDVLWYDNQVLTNKPYEQRIKYLKEIFVPEEGVLMLTERQKVTSKEQVMDALNNAIDNKLEGIILKEPVAVYKPSTRKGGWFKIKPEYTDGLMDHVDTLIMGGYYGEGRRSGFISHFLVGLAQVNEDGTPEEIHSLTRVGSGYTLTKLEELLARLEPHWKRVLPGAPCPPRLHWGRERPDVWIEPEKSFILEIKATEIARSQRGAFKMEHTLRFPRVEDIRYDKKWTECMTTVQFEALRQNAAGKLASKHVTAEDGDNESPKKRRLAYSAPCLPPHFMPADLSDVTRKSDMLTGKEFCVVTDHDELTTKQDIEKKIHTFGGTVVQNPGCNTFCVLTSYLNVRSKNMVACRRYNVVKTDWLLQCVNAKQLLPWRPADLLGATPETEEQMRHKCDEYGDSYTEPATMESLKYSMDQVEKLGKLELLNDVQMAEMDVLLFGGTSPFSLFRLCQAYFDIYQTINDPTSKKSTRLDIAAAVFKFYSGIIHENISEETTHIIISSRDKSRLKALCDLNHQRARKFHIVTEQWVEKCLKEKRRLPEVLPLE